MADNPDFVDDTLTLENTFSDWLQLYDGGTTSRFTVKVDGTFVARVTVQYKRRGEADAVAVDDEDPVLTGPVVKSGVLDGRGPWEVRAGVKTGDFTSGSVHITIGP